MCKEEQMVEYMVQDLTELLSEFTGEEYDDAMRVVYHSEIYNKVLEYETGLYRESPYYVCGVLQDELNFGHIVQGEI